MTDLKLAIVFDGPPSHESGRFVEVELNGASIAFGDWQQNGEYWELVFPEPFGRLATLEIALKVLRRNLCTCGFVEYEARAAHKPDCQYRKMLAGEQLNV